MKNITLTISLFLVPFLLKSQDKFTIDLKSDFGFYNSALDAQTLLNSFAYIDDEQKQSILNTMGNENFYFVDIHNTFKFSNRKGLSLAFGNHVTSYGIFDRELVRLALYGNSQHSAERLDLTPFEGEFLHYSDITVGFKLSNKMSSSVSLIAAHQFISGDASKFDLISDYGNSIFYDIEMEGVENGYYQDLIDNRSDLYRLRGLGDLFSSGGRGFSLGFDFKGEAYGGKYAVSVNELGFIRWDETTNHYDIQSDDLIVPIEFSDFSDIDISDYADEIDTLTDITNPYNDKYIFVLPARLNGNFSKEILGNKYTDRYTVSYEHRLGMFPSPRLAIDLHKSVKKNEFVLGFHRGGLEKNGIQFKYNYKSDWMHFQFFTRQASVFNLNSMHGLNIGFGLKFLIGKKDKEEVEQ